MFYVEAYVKIIMLLTKNYTIMKIIEILFRIKDLLIILRMQFSNKKVKIFKKQNRRDIGLRIK